MTIQTGNFLLIYSSIMVFILGLIFGSFLNCYSDRYITHIPIYKGRSKCDNCGKELKALDLIPIISWLFSKGKCRYCGNKISIKYPLTELFSGIMFLIILYRFDLSIKTIVYLMLYSCLFVLSLVDIKIYEIPDICIVISIICWIILNLYEHNWLSGLYGGLIISFLVLLISLIMNKLLKKESLGGGDIKLLFVTGLYLGFVGNLFCLLLSCIIGMVFVIVLKKDVIPFGPSISIACMIMLLWGSKIIDLYLGII